MKITQNNIKDVYRSKKCSIETAELRGYELIENLFVDSSGWGAEDEPALTAGQFEKKLLDIIKEHGPVYAFLTDAGQFQVYLGLFKRTGKSKCKKIANNTYEISRAGVFSIRLHDTDIITIKGDKIILSSGGYRTRTTKDRLNKYLPYGRVFQKDYEWFFQDGKNVLEFFDGMEINKI
jgi:hypothetical protein